MVEGGRGGPPLIGIWTAWGGGEPPPDPDMDSWGGGGGPPRTRVGQAGGGGGSLNRDTAVQCNRVQQIGCAIGISSTYLYCTSSYFNFNCGTIGPRKHRP